MCYYKRGVTFRTTEVTWGNHWGKKQLSDSDMYEDICLEKIRKLYKSSSKCDDQQKYKAILEAEIVSTPEELFGKHSNG